MTNREFFNVIVNGSVEVVDNNTTDTSVKTVNLLNSDGSINAEIVEFAKNAIAKLDEKNAKKKNTLTATQKTNIDIKKNIIETMEIDKTYTAKQIADMCNIETTQKTSALLRQLAAEAKVKVIDGFKPENAKTKVKGYIKITENEITNEETE